MNYDVQTCASYNQVSYIKGGNLTTGNIYTNSSLVDNFYRGGKSKMASPPSLLLFSCF